MFSDGFEFDELNTIIKVVCKYFGMSIETMESKTRKRYVVIPRQFIHYFARFKTAHSLSVIGSMAGQKDHSTVSSSIKTINDLLLFDTQIKRDYKNLNALLCQ